MIVAFDPAASFQLYILACLALGVLLFSKCLVQMFLPRCTTGWMEAVAAVAASLLAFMLGRDALGNDRMLAGVGPALFPPLTLGFAATLVAAHLGVALLHSRCQRLASHPVAWLAVSLTLIAIVWSSYRCHSGKLQIELQRATYFAGAGELEEVCEFVAVTDRGREVALCRWLKDEKVNISATRQAAEDISQANCHGWVFTGGKYFVWGEGVEKILDDNGYQPCDTLPRPGDLIVYRDVYGEITHTGLVKGGFLWGTLIDSKWGLGGRFVHGPEQQPYGNKYSYYRSARDGHSLGIRPARPPWRAMRIASR
jgi:hypothetical protein